MRMNIMQLLVTTGITAVIQAAVGVVIYKLIQRQDDKLDLMSQRIQTLEDNRLKAIDLRLANGSEEFREIQAKQDTLVRERDCLLRMEEKESAIHAVSTRLSGVSAQLGNLEGIVSGVDRIVTLIAQHLHIRIGDA
jgi:elongation factor P--beta-lysine ligase